MREKIQTTIYRDGRHYDAKYDHLVEDIPFFYGLIIDFGEPVLELCCGTGRIAIPLARQGVDITGLDVNESMLSEARRKSNEAGVRVEWVKGDCCDFEISRSFKLIFIPFNSICHVHELSDLESMLGCVRSHLAPGGRFVVDVFNPDMGLLVDQEEEKRVADYPDPDGSGRVIVMESATYDRSAQIKLVRWRLLFADGRETIEELVQRIYFPRELDAIIKYNGFAIEKKYGDYDRSGFGMESAKQLIVCRAR